MASRSPTNRFRPVPWPRTGLVERLYVNIAKGHADVYIHQKPWPRQPQNPNWRIEVTGIDGRHAEETKTRIRKACEETARDFLGLWLVEEAPLLTIATVTWPELVRLATERRYKTLSPYQQRRTKVMGKHAPLHANRTVSNATTGRSHSPSLSLEAD